jgi:hypothetical protein
MARRGRLAIWLLVIAGIVAVGMINWHLVHVATMSQPECVAHVRVGEGDRERGMFSAAQSSCTP